jgi:glycosyltransferase involved in cell wall biosynthesis
MRISHICVNYGAPLFQELFLALEKYNLEQNVFYPRNRTHLAANTDNPFEVNSPLVLNLFTKISFRRKRLIMQQQYNSFFGSKMPDLMHAHTLFSDGSLANHYYKKYRIPYIVAFRSTDVEYFLKYKPWLKKYGRQIAENSEYIVFISPSLKKKFQQIYGTCFESKSMVIPNGIHPSYFTTGEIERRDLHSPLELLYVGSFLKRKNVPPLIRLTESCNARLTIVGGGGNQEKRVLQMIQNSGKVDYLGTIEDQSRMVDIYRQSDILIMTSRGETFGLVYIEAMSQGLPVLYSKDTGIDGLFEQGEVGYGVTPGSISEMKTGIDKIVSKYHKISQNCVILAKQMNWTKIAETYFDLYGKILN